MIKRLLITLSTSTMFFVPISLKITSDPSNINSVLTPLKQKSINDQQNLELAVKILKSYCVPIFEIPDGTTAADLKKLIKNHWWFATVVCKDGITLKQHFTLKQSNIELANNEIISNNSLIVVEGTLQSGIEETNFLFRITVYW